MEKVMGSVRDPNRTKLSIVSTLYKSERYIHEFHERAKRAAEQLVGNDYEILLINDGSPDDSLAVAVEIASSEAEVYVVDLSRNFGHHKAMMTGLAHAGGERVFLIDSDLEEDPEWLLSFAGQMNEEHCDVVYGVQSHRKGRFFERWSGKWFYRIFNALTGLALPENIVVARLMTRRYVDALLRHDEREIFLAGLWHITGFDQHPQIITKRDKRESTYSFRHKVALLVNSVTSFSNAPLHAIFYIGVLISIVAGLSIVYLLIQRLFVSAPLSGWTSVMASIWLIGGLIISFIGIIGIYLAKIFSETKKRPYTIVRHVYGRGDRGGEQILPASRGKRVQK